MKNPRRKSLYGPKGTRLTVKSYTELHLSKSIAKKNSFEGFNSAENHTVNLIIQKYGYTQRSSEGSHCPVYNI